MPHPHFVLIPFDLFSFLLDIIRTEMVGRGRGRGRGETKNTLNIKTIPLNPGCNIFARSLNSIKTDEGRKADEPLPPTLKCSVSRQTSINSDEGIGEDEQSSSRRPSYSRQISHKSDEGIGDEQVSSPLCGADDEWAAPHSLSKRPLTTAVKFVNPLLANRSYVKDNVTNSLNKLMISTDLKVKRLNSNDSNDTSSNVKDNIEGMPDQVFVKPSLREWDQKKFWCPVSNMWMTKGDRDCQW